CRSSLPTFCPFFVACSGDLPYLHSFPTRRSSDLGAVLASILWLLAGAIFSIYVENWGNFELTFGSVSAAVVLLLWMYNSAQILVLGAAFNAEIERADTGRPPPA